MPARPPSDIACSRSSSRSERNIRSSPRIPSTTRRSRSSSREPLRAYRRRFIGTIQRVWAYVAWFAQRLVDARTHAQRRSGARARGDPPNSLAVAPATTQVPAGTTTSTRCAMNAEVGINRSLWGTLTAAGRGEYHRQSPDSGYRCRPPDDAASVHGRRQPWASSRGSFSEPSLAGSRT